MNKTDNFDKPELTVQDLRSMVTLIAMQISLGMATLPRSGSKEEQEAHFKRIIDNSSMVLKASLISRGVTVNEGAVQ